ncbi:MAG: hypothetical protein WCI77_02405 [Candidatus Omnitrophota bacterium]
MKRVTKAALVISFVVVLSLPVYARSFIGIGTVGIFEPQIEPELLAPVTEEVDLSGKDSLEFKWLRRSLIGVDHYDFRLYKGYDMYGSNLILQEKVPYNAGSIKVKADLFEIDQVYTWSLVRVADNGNKSEKSFYSFRVAKK